MWGLSLQLGAPSVHSLIDSLEDATASTVRRSKPYDRGIYDSLSSHAFETGGRKLAFFVLIGDLVQQNV